MHCQIQVWMVVCKTHGEYYKSLIAGWMKTSEKKTLMLKSLNIFSVPNHFMYEGKISGP